MRTSIDGDELIDFLERRKPKQPEFALYLQRFEKRLKQAVELFDIEELDRAHGNLIELTSKHRPFLHRSSGLALLLLALTTEAPPNCHSSARVKVIAYLLENGAALHLTKPELSDDALAEKTKDPEIIELFARHKQNPDETFDRAAERYRLQEKIERAAHQFQLFKLQVLLEEWISLSEEPEPLNTPVGWYVLHTVLSRRLDVFQGSSALIEFLNFLFDHGAAHQIKEFRSPCRPIDRARAVHQKSHPEIIRHLENALLKVQAIAHAAPPTEDKLAKDFVSQDNTSPSAIPSLVYRSNSSGTVPESTVSNEHNQQDPSNLPGVVSESLPAHKERRRPVFRQVQKQTSDANLPLPSKQSIENLLDYEKMQAAAQTAKKESKAWRCPGMCAIS